MLEETKKSKIVFIAEGNNELDHYLPLVSKFNGQATIVFNPSVEAVLTNEVHQCICSKFDVELLSMSKFFKMGVLGKAYSKLHNLFSFIYRFYKSKFIRKAFIFTLTMFKKEMNTAIDKERILKVFGEFDWSIVDVKVLNLNNKSNPLIPFLLELESLKIKNLMISHGLTITHAKTSSKKDNEHEIFKPYTMCCCNEGELQGFQSQLPGVTIKPIGDLRYDKGYIQLLRDTHSEMSPLASQYCKKNSILYLVGNIPGDLNEQVHRDIIYSCLEQFDNVIVKLHPRNPYFLTEFLGNKRVIQASNDIDTSRLIEEHDWMISAFSGVIMHGILQSKQAVIYRPEYLKNMQMIFDDSEIFQASNVNQLKKLKSEYIDKSHEVHDFYIKYYSAGEKSSIVDRHLNYISSN